ncbi:MAG: hypothetical protein GY829_02335, partial [Gammaproteobacteria bacterium]|nr:hypothetical protein [Gammaproteobacteria bacterium]
PHDFGFNEQTGVDNIFQHKPSSVNEAKSIANKAMHEFEQIVNLLDKSNLEILVLDKPQTSEVLPDAIFPNNWFSTRADGQIFIYPMKTANRQAEVQYTELKSLLTEHNYQISGTTDLRDKNLTALEGTGSLIFHHPSGTVFAALSERCHIESLEYFSTKYDYDLFSFATSSQEGTAIYHTNVLMSCGEDFAVITDEVLINHSSSKSAIEKLQSIVSHVIHISEQQMTESFCGNILQLRDSRSQPVIVLSESAYKGFTAPQISILEKNGSLLVCPIPTIEYIGGGSARCMIAENFLKLI